MYFTRFFTILMLLGIVGTGCRSSLRMDPAKSNAGGADQVVLMLNWYPEAEHGGFYAAQAHGIFEQYGLEVEIRPGGPNAPVAQELVAGRVQFAIGNADDVLLFQAQDAATVALLAPIQNTPRCILVRETSSVTSLKDLAGLRLQANAGRPFLDFMKSEGLLENVQVVPYPGTVANLVADENTAIQAYSFSEPLLAEQQGVKVRKLMLSDAGFNPYASCLLTTRTYIDKNEDIASRMVVACRLGWQKYLESPEETNRLILSQNKQGMTLEALTFGVEELRPLCLPEGLPVEELGSMSAERWQQLIDQFVKLGLLSESKLSAADVFTSQFTDRSAPVE